LEENTNVASVQTLINLENVTKIFYTDEVETHALSGIHLDIKKGEYVAIAGPSGFSHRRILYPE
jgi:putative ABC transport system ATP-binding protein